MTDLALDAIKPVTGSSRRLWPASLRFGLPSQKLLPWLLPVTILTLWQLASSVGALPASILPSPTSVFFAARRLILSGELQGHIATSFSRAATGLLIGGSIAFTLGLSNGLSRLSERLLDTTLQMIRNIPNLALIPLVILWFGIDETSKLFLVSLGVFFPIYINTFHGIRTVDSQLVEMARSYGFHGFQLFRRVIFPGALPSILVGLRYALGIMWLTLIVAESIAAQSGLGYMAMSAREFMQTDVVVLAILIYALLGKAADSTVRALERWSLSWHPAYRKGGTR
jgi:sulfonate transport system permease protein